MTDEKQTPSLEAFAEGLIADLEDLRAGRITIKEAKARTDLAREVLRAFHLNLQGLRYLSGQAKQIPSANGVRGGSSGDDENEEGGGHA